MYVQVIGYAEGTDWAALKPKSGLHSGLRYLPWKARIEPGTTEYCHSIMLWNISCNMSRAYCRLSGTKEPLDVLFVDSFERTQLYTS